VSEVVLEKPKCRWCRSDIPEAKATICSVCKWPQVSIECRVCQRAIPENATFCNDCKSYQGSVLRWIPRSLIGLSLITTLVAVINPAVTAFDWYRHYDSKTSANLFMPPDLNKISLYVWNSGRNPSAVLHCRLHYTDSEDDDLELVPFDAKQVLIGANAQSVLDLKVPKVEKQPFAKGPAKVLVEIQESNGNLNKFTRDLPPYFLIAIRDNFNAPGRGASK